MSYVFNPFTNNLDVVDQTTGFISGTTTQYDVIVGAGSNTVTSVGPGSAGQVLQSGGNAANPAYSTATYPATAGTTGNVLKSDGTNFISSIPTTWTDTSGAFSPLAQNAYFITTTATGTLPASPAQGDTITFTCDTANVLTIAPSGSQLMRIGSSVTTVTTGRLASTAIGDSITLVYRSSDTTWIARSSMGNWTVT